MTKADKIAKIYAPTSDVERQQPASNDEAENIIVIGAGPAGIRFCLELLKRRVGARITVFGNEPYQPYNRVQLSALLAGDISYDEIITALPDAHKHPNFSHLIAAIHSIDSANKTITDINGATHAYDKLIIATGSRPHQPHIPGIAQAGVYTFRNLKDAEFLFARVSSARHIVVVGGGLLGLESAKALSRFNTRVTVVQQGPRLMNRQLDEEAASELQGIVEGLKIRVITNSGVRRIVGEGRVSGIVTRDQEHIECDTVLICAGIKPNIEIARNAKIKIARGILVNDQLQTSVPDIYAIGECCEHRGSTYGLVNPGYEQAAVLADILSSGNANYKGSLEVSRLKVLGTSICSMGSTSDIAKRPFLHEFKYRNKKSQSYRKIVTLRGRLIGAVGFGDWQESRRVQEAYQHQRRLWPWHILMFVLTGRLFAPAQDNVKLWPKAAIVCQCNNVSQGELVKAIDNGHDTLVKLHEFTKAGSVCGSCRPLMMQLLGNTEPLAKQKAWIVTLGASAIAGLIALAIIFLPELRVSDTVQAKNILEGIWNDKFFKQVTGFSLLGMSVIGLSMSFRKRIANKRLGDYAYWRVLHIILGVLCAAVLVLHTGLHLGANFNQILMVNFLGILLLGSLTGAVLSLSHKFSATTAKNIRSFWTWAHVLFTWPFPVLLGFHILTVYYF